MIRILNVVAIVLIAALALGLYKSKQEASSDMARIESLSDEIAREREALRTLLSEMAHLEDPARLRALASEHLGLEVIDPLRVVALEDAALMYEPAAPVLGAVAASPHGATLAADTRAEPRP